MAVLEVLAVPLAQVSTATEDGRLDIHQMASVPQWALAESMEDIVPRTHIEKEMESGQQSLSTSSLEPLSIVILPPGTTLTTIIRAPITSVETFISTADHPRETTWSSRDPAEPSKLLKPPYRVGYSDEPAPTSKSAVVPSSKHESTVTVTITPTSTITITPSSEPQVDDNTEQPTSGTMELSEPSTTRAVTSDTVPDYPVSWVYSTVTTVITHTESITGQPLSPTNSYGPGEDSPHEESHAEPFTFSHPVIFSIALGAAMAIAFI